MSTNPLSLKKEILYLDQLLATQDEEIQEIRRLKTDALTIRVVDNIHKWYVIVAEKELLHEY